MTITVDLNVVLDMLLERGQYGACLELLTLCKEGKVHGLIPSHGMPTIYYALRKALGNESALASVKKLLRALDIFPITKAITLSAVEMNFRDFEDAIVAACAEASGSKYVVTRDIRDYKYSKVPAIVPEEFLEIYPF